MSLQTLCRYRIRELLREVIKRSYPTYYDLKKRVKKPQDDPPIIEYSTGYATRLILGHNSYTEAEFRLLMHGRLNFESHEDEIDEDNDEDGEDDDDDDDDAHDIGDDHVDDNVLEALEDDNNFLELGRILDDLSDEVINLSASQMSTINTNNVEETIPIPCKKEITDNRSFCESGFSEGEPLSSSSSSNGKLINNETNNNTCQHSLAINENINNIDFESVNSHRNSFSPEHSVSSISPPNMQKNLSSDEPSEIKVDENSSCIKIGDNQTVQTLNNCMNQEEEEEIEKKIEIAEKLKEAEELYVNHLRIKILKLEIPTALKNFLLYNREI